MEGRREIAYLVLPNIVCCHGCTTTVLLLGSVDPYSSNTTGLPVAVPMLSCCVIHSLTQMLL